MRRFNNPNDVLAGAFLIASAIVTFVLSRYLHAGPSAPLEPGYVTQVLCFIQVALGAGVILCDITLENGPLEAWFPRPLFWILISIVFFAMSLERLGLFIAIVGLVLLSCLGNRDTKPLTALALAVGMATFSVLIFAVALGLPVPITPPLR